jgi:hypothetical protein
MRGLIALITICSATLSLVGMFESLKLYREGEKLGGFDGAFRCGDCDAWHLAEHEQPTTSTMVADQRLGISRF